MVRTRIPEASLVGLLAALATFCALEARGGQPYSIVGQSSPATAATGRRPIAERIKAANRPIRIAAEEELAPDQGLIPSLDDPTTVEREWIAYPAVVEFPAGGPDAIAIDRALPTLEPGVMPPPDSTAVAAHPTTGDDAGLVGEASSIETHASATTADKDESTGDSPQASPTATKDSATPPDRLSASAPPRAQATQAPSPRRTIAPVTPQRREALLDRLRAALADVPRPLGLIPASRRQKAGSRQAHTAHTAIARHPVAAASLPVPLTALPATTTPTAETLPSDSLAETPLTGTMPADGSKIGGDIADASAIADRGSTIEPTAAEDAPATLVADLVPTTADATDDLVDADAPGIGAAANDACLASLTAEPEVSIDVAAPTDAIAAVDGVTETTDSSAMPAADLATPPATPPAADLAADLAATPAPQQARTTHNAQSRRHGGGQRTGASHAPQQPMRPFDRLQARLEQMPRALGLVPAPRPSMHANRAPQRRAASPAPAAASLSSAAAESTSATTAPAEPALADRNTVANDEAGEAPQAPSTTEGDVAVASQAEATIGDEGSAEPTNPTPDKPTLVTDVDIDQDHLAIVEEGEATICSPVTDAESIKEDVDAVKLAASPDEPALVATTVEESAIPAAVAESMPAAGMSSAAVAKRPATHPARQLAAPIVRRPIRDALGTALANMPRPFGLLPTPEAAPRRSAASQANVPAAPRALATKSIGTRPLDAGTKAQPGNAQAIVAAPPALPQSADDGATLASGNRVEDHAENAEMPAAIAGSTTEPAPLDVDLSEGASEAEALQASPASVEVTVECPEETTTLGERVTLHLTIRNTSTAPVCSVTPVVHFGAGLEPLGIRGRNGHFSADGSVVFERLAELPAGACVELEIVAVCTGTGTIPYRGAAWCGDGEDREIVPADDSVTVIASALATEPATVRQR